MRAVWPEPSPAVLLPSWAAGISEVSRFSCMKFLGVSWGLRLRRTEQETRMIASAHVACRDYKRVGVLIASFRSSLAQPTYTPVYASLCTSRYPTQNSGPSESLVLSRRVSSTPASYRFSPAHCNKISLIVIACMTPQLKVVHLESFHTSAQLTAPTVSFKYLSMEFPVRIRIEFEAGPLAHDAIPATCSKKARFCGAGRNL
jgi:hypothetical protein